MKREQKDNEKLRKRNMWVSIIGFLVAITLLSTAIIISLNQSEDTQRANTNILSSNYLKETSESLNKGINVTSNNAMLNILDSSQKSSNTTNTVATNSNVLTINENVEQEPKQEDSNRNEASTKNEEGQKSDKVIDENSFILPVDGKIIKEFSMNELVYSETLQEWTTHRGIDIEADKTTVVKASSSGTVKSIKQDPRYGLSVIIEHSNGFTSVYSSLLSSEFVKEGEKVEQGQSIGTVGNSAVFESSDGSHLHFEILKDGEYVNPELYIK